ncbi:MAG: hypothetical protein U1F53_23745 [Burkholderiaceae bacterium]
MKPHFFFVPFVVLLSQAVFAATVGPVDVISGGTVTIMGGPKGPLVEASIATYALQGNTPQEGDKAFLAKDCPWGKAPCSLVEDLALRVGKSQIYVPRSAFGGLANVRQAELTTPSPGRFRLLLRGGDASESYIAIIDFDKDRVMKRQISSALSPRDVLEETVYRLQKESFDR